MPSWTKVIDKGGGRPLDVDGSVQNVGISDMMAYGDSLYLGVDVPTGRKPPAEMWRLRMSDNRLTVVIGEPRLDFGTGTISTNPAYPFNLRCDVPLEDIDGIGGNERLSAHVAERSGLRRAWIRGNGLPGGNAIVLLALF